MNPTILVLLAFVLVSSVNNKVHASREQQCSKVNNSLVKLSIVSRRNESGHWQSQIGFNPAGGTVNVNKRDTWSLDVEQSTTTTCEGVEGILITATITQEPTSKLRPRQIPSGYELFPSVGYYKFHPESVDWPRARQMCAEEGTQLVIVNTENEANVLKQFFSRYPKEKLPNYDAYDSIWVGIYEQGANGQYFTIFGDTLNSTGFQRWHPGRPAVAGSDECVIVYRPSAGYYDLACDRRAPFVCELPE